MHPEECLAAGIKSVSDTKQCAHCETKPRTDEKLKSHIYNVHKDKRAEHPDIQPTHTCDECGEGFHGKQRLRQHILWHHSKSSFCKLCHRAFVSPSSLEEHNKKEHSNPNTVHACDLCNAKYNIKKTLKEHIRRVHGGGDVYKHTCPHCKGRNSKFHKKETLDKHIEDCHSGKEYICSQCPSVFYSPMARGGHEEKTHAD